MELKSVETKDWSVIQRGLKNSMNYDDYSLLVEEMVEQKKSTGDNQEEKFVSFTKLNFQRSKRLNKTATLTESFKRKLDVIKSNLTWLVITESWCGDAVQALPFFKAAADYTDKITVKIVLRDENTDLMDMFLTNGGRSIPKLIVLDEENKNVLGDWGPRPSEAQEMYMDFRNNPNGRVYEDVQLDLQRWYLKDKGVTMQKEIEHIL